VITIDCEDPRIPDGGEFPPLTPEKAGGVALGIQRVAARTGQGT
jgi:hypothetical protein